MFKKITSLIIAAASLTTLTGCASIVSGTNQPVSVNTGAVTGATCSLENNKGRWHIANTPSSVVVHRSYHDLKIACNKKGVGQGFKKVSSSTKAMVFGNALLGGGIGAGVDMASGAAYDYPNEVYVPLHSKA